MYSEIFSNFVLLNTSHLIEKMLPMSFLININSVEKKFLKLVYLLRTLSYTSNYIWYLKYRMKKLTRNLIFCRNTFTNLGIDTQ